MQQLSVLRSTVEVNIAETVRSEAEENRILQNNHKVIPSTVNVKLSLSGQGTTVNTDFIRSSTYAKHCKTKLIIVRGYLWASMSLELEPS